MKDPDIYDWEKLKWVLKPPSQTIGDNRVIGAGNIYEVLNYLDASCAMHDDMRGHTGSCMTFGWGLIHAKLSKQKFNTKISTESEVVGTSNYIPFGIWLAMYM